MKQRTTSATFCVLGLCVLGLALGGVALATFQDDGAPPKGDKTPAAATDGAKDDGPRVVGKVLFDGELPEVAELKVSAAAANGCCPPGEEVDRRDLSLVIDKDRGIANVVVTVTVKDAKVEIPEEPFVVDQKGCRFVPHLQVVPKGAKVAFLNSDETSHNVHLITLVNDPLNQTVLAGKKLERTFKEPESIKVTCDMHTWMQSWLVVTDATHWAVTDASGAFALAGLPPGEHEVTLWHESLGSKKAKVMVGEDGKAGPLEVKMAKKKRKTSRRR